MTGYQVSGQIADEAVAITKSDTADNTFSYLYIGTGGDVAVTPQGSTSAVTFSSVPSGSFLWVRTKLVMSTNTTASNMVGLR